MKQQRFLIPAVLCLLLALLAWQRWQTPHSRELAVPVIASDIQTVIDTSPASDTFPSIDAFHAMIERPLFMEDRQPFTPAAPEQAKESIVPRQAAPVTRPLEHRLIGVILTPEQRIALLQGPRDNKPKHIRPGETIDGWTLDAIQPEQVTLSRAGETQQLALTVIASPAMIQQPAEETTVLNAETIPGLQAATADRDEMEIAESLEPDEP
jgi:hypothetical protein